MSDETETLLRRLISDDQAAAAAVLVRARTSEIPALLVAAALISGDSGGLLERATAHATTTRDRQLVAIATAHLEGDHDLFDALIRDHLADHPDNVLAAWIATRHAQGHVPFPY
jgi:hypothetical protein